MSTTSPLETIFFAALEKGSPAERASYLDEACGNDRTLRDQIERMLAAQAKAGSFLEAPAVGIDRTIGLPPIAEGPGTIIGRYKLLEEIAEGGMGVVYMAEQREPVRRKVALKIIKPGMDTREVIARFEAERQALAMMDHLNIAKVLDAGETASGRSYFVMELVHGIHLTDYCDQNELTSRERLELFVQVCQAVNHAHQKGIIHRDIKPSNVMVTLYDGVPIPKIIDFGIAKATHGQITERTVFTHYGQMIGSPLYMSPEQAEMSGLDVDTRSDIYSLGMMLYELLTGSTPFDQERVREAGFDEIRRIIREDDPPRPSARISTLGAAATVISGHRKTDPARLSQLLRGDLDWIVMKAIQKDRSRRYQTASDFARDIERYLQDEPVEARPPTLADRVAKWARRHRPLVWSAVVLLVLGTIGSVISTLLIAGAYKEKNQQLTATEKAEDLAREQEGLAKQQEEAAKKQAAMAREQQRLAHEQKEEAVQQREISDANLYVSHMRLAPHDWEQGQIGRLYEMLDSHIPLPGRHDLRGWEWYYYLSLCHKDLMTLRTRVFGGQSIAWSPDGNRLASAGTDGTIQIWNAASGRRILNFSAGEGPTHAVAWSPDGKRLASGSFDGTASIWDAVTWKNVFTFRGFNGQVRSLAWSPDGRHLAASGSPPHTREMVKAAETVKVWDATKGQEIVDLTGKAREPVAWSPDGKRLATGKGRNFQILDALTGRELRSFSSNGELLLSLAWSPDGKRLASGEYGNWARVWEADTGRELLKLWYPGAIEHIAWSPDGTRLATASEAQRITVSDSTTGKEILSLQGHRGKVSSVAWSPDGTRLASAGWEDEAVKIWSTLGKQDGLAIDRARAKWLAWSPKGDRVASAGGGKVKLWDPRTGEEVWSLDVPAESLVWSADGKYLAAGKEDAAVIVDTESRKRIVALPTNGHAAMSWSPVTPRLAIGTNGSDDVEVWDILTERKVIWHCHNAEIPGVASLVPGVASLAWSPDGSRVALGEESGLVEIWDAATAKCLLVLRGQTERMVLSVVWSPDGRHVASGGWDGKVRVWDVSHGRELLTLVGHTGPVNLVAWTRDGKRLTSASADGTVKIWDPAMGQELFSLVGSCLAWSPDGERLAAGGDPEGTIHFYDASSGYKLAASPAYQMDVAMRQGRLDAALAIFERLAAEFPDRPEYRRSLAEAYCARGRAAFYAGDHERALPDFDQAIRLDSENAGAYNARANIYLFDKGELDRAISECDKAIQFAPGAIHVYNKRAEAYYRKGQHDKALIDYCEEVLRIHPSDGGAKNQLAWCLATHPDPQCRNAIRAVELAKQAVALDPRDYNNTLNTLGVAQYRAGDYRSAIKTFDKAMELTPGSSVYDWFFLAMAHFQLGHKAEARTLYDKAVQWTQETSPYDEEPLRFRAEAAQLLGIPETTLPAKQQPEKSNNQAPSPKVKI